MTIKNAVCLHEEDFGILWKHTDWRTNETEVRRSRRLAVSMIATVGNYDYGFYWYFYQDGTIQMEVKLTGIMNTTALNSDEPARYGTEVAPRLLAPNHQHFFCARLDVDIDGQTNAAQEVNTQSVPAGADNPHGNAFVAEVTPLSTESTAQRTTNPLSSRFWRFINSTRKNEFGGPVGYRLCPGENTPPYALSTAAIIQRAGFLTKNIWVTPYEPGERIRPVITPTRTLAATAFLDGRRQTVTSRGPTWSSGTPLAIPTSPASRTGRSCRSIRSAF